MREIDISHLRGWIGREEVSTDIVAADLAHRYHATMDMPGEAPKQGKPVPRLIHFCLAQPAVATAGLGPDGHPDRGGFLPPVPLPRRMWAGGALTFHGDLRVGDEIRRISRVEDVSLKEGRTGLLCFITVRHDIETNGCLLIEERQDIVYRGVGSPDDVGKAPPVAEQGEHQQQMRAGPLLLFRYSALTFNGHRIHYDRRYAAEAEGYPGLVVHGPLQAALLCNFATRLRGAQPKHFAFRGVSPLSDDEAFVLHARAGEEGLKLWTARQGGAVCMTAAAK